MRVNQLLSVVAATPINIATGTSTAPAASSPPMYASRLFIQAVHGGTGLVYVMDGIQVGKTPATSTAGHLTAELAPATSTAPGGAYSDADPSGGIDLRKIWIDGGHTADTVIVSYDLAS